ncbi:MAG: Gfo/Idh/MocA family oxidoreductase [Thermoguttaceae bacterium]|nr:Gfo/Idh/MocA family oxidoreductase [Thermoguttaceae bacterium]
MTKTIKFGIIGGGLMGREFASAAARWCHLLEADLRPELVAVCDTNPAIHTWYKENFPTVTLTTADYKELLAGPGIEAVYCAVPHNLHAEIYTAVIRAGKHLMGEKPFGIDKAANDRIMRAIDENPDVLVRCSSEFPFYPAVQAIGRMIASRQFGRIIEVETGFLHSSDLDPNKPINWKRMIEFNGEYGCMGDLGIHACHIPFRAGWYPKNVRAILRKLVTERPDGKGGKVPCKTWDNATLFCEAADPAAPGDVFPLSIKTFRIAPGEKDTWTVKILGTEKSAFFSTKNPRRLEILEYAGGASQNWQQIDMGYDTAFKTITGGIFEFGFPDAILQMWASFLYEIEHGAPKELFAGCVTPGEAAASHRLFTAALESQRTGKTVSLELKTV